MVEALEKLASNKDKARAMPIFTRGFDIDRVGQEEVVKMKRALAELRRIYNGFYWLDSIRGWIICSFRKFNFIRTNYLFSFINKSFKYA